MESNVNPMGLAHLGLERLIIQSVGLVAYRLLLGLYDVVYGCLLRLETSEIEFVDA